VKTSESIAHLAAALVQAQAEIKSIHKDRENSHFRNKYATLDAIVETVRPILAKHGLAVVQGATMPHTSEGGTLVAFAVGTRLVHQSGEWMESYALMPLAKLDPQGAGAALTYGRRYSLSALLSLATDDDDDGESAVAPRHAAPARPAAPRPAAAAPARSKEDEAFAAAKELLDLEQIPSCPKCGGAMYDNREQNQQRVAQGLKARPSFACKDRQSCDGIIWSASGKDEPRGGAAPKRAPKPAPAPVPDFDEPPAFGDDTLPF
jgi:hypothetical protein